MKNKEVKKKKKFYRRKRFWLLCLIGLVAVGGNSNSQKDIETINHNILVEETATEDQEETKETDTYGWTDNDYEEFSVAVKMVARNYLTKFKLPHYTKWQFCEYDNESRILAVTDELTFKDDHEKHTVICIFSLSGDVGDSGLHEEVKYSFFGTDEKTYYNDGTCEGIFDVLKSLSK